jgi:hypothetical protein
MGEVEKTREEEIVVGKSRRLDKINDKLSLRSV